MVAETSPTTPPAADRTLVIERLFAAPRALVFAVWSEPRHLARWWGPKDFTLASCAMEFRVGGAYRLCMRSPAGEDFWVQGIYREIAAPERLVFTWEREGRGTSEVAITLAEHAAGTRFTLRHAGFATVADRDEHGGGWGECVDRLAAYVVTAG